jgi:hypothetical protein
MTISAPLVQPIGLTKSTSSQPTQRPGVQLPNRPTQPRARPHLHQVPFPFPQERVRGWRRVWSGGGAFRLPVMQKVGSASGGEGVCGWVVAHYRGRGASAAEEYRAGGEQEAANGEVVGGGLAPLRFRAATRIPGSALAGFLPSSRAD